MATKITMKIEKVDMFKQNHLLSLSKSPFANSIEKYLWDDVASVELRNANIPTTPPTTL